MKLKAVFGCVVLVGLTVAITSQVVSQQTEPGSDEHTQMMAAWMKYAEPGKHHEHLAPLVGKWDYTVKMWMYPGSAAEESTGTAENKWILGGRYLLQKMHGEMEGETFEGISLLGYDNFREEYVSLWIDSMTTGFMLSRGTCDGTGRVITYTGTHDEIHTEQKDKYFKAVNRMLGPDRFLYEMYAKGPDGKEFKTLEVTSTRKK